MRRIAPIIGIIVALLTGPAPVPAVEDVLRISLATEPPTLDPSLATDHVSIQVVNNLFDGLTAYDDQLQPIPAVARSWERSDDGLTFTFHLREDARWNDGVPVMAHDFVYSWRRLLNPETAAEYAYFLFDVQNAREYNSGQIEDPEQVGVKALDDYTLQVRLKSPIVFFPSITTFMVTFPLRKDVIEKYGPHWTEPQNMVVNGPYRLETWWHEYRLTIRANENYWGEPKPSVGRVKIFLVNEQNTELSLFETGALDWVDNLLKEAIPIWRNKPQYRSVPQLRGYYYGFNTTKKPFDDPRMRRAFSMAVDRSQLPEILQGGEIPMTSWIPPGMLGYNPNIGLGYDPEGARRLLAEAGYPDGKGVPKISLMYNTKETHKAVAENIQAQWKDVLGVQVEIKNQEWKVFLKTVQNDPPQIYRLGWGADYPDPDNFMNLFTSYSGNNHTHWSSDEYDRIIEEAARTADPDKRQALYDRAQTILTEEAVPIMPLMVTAMNKLVAPYVEDLRLNPLDQYHFKHVEIERKEP